MAPSGPRKSDPVLTVRRVFVHSLARAEAGYRPGPQAGPGPAGPGPPESCPGHAPLSQPGGRHRPGQRDQPPAPGGRLPAHVHRYRCGGRPTLGWEFDQAVIDAAAAGAGWYALLTDLRPTEADTVGVLARYQGQDVVERRYGDIKGPLTVAPMVRTTGGSPR
jgi:hypothetical protein